MNTVSAHDLNIDVADVEHKLSDNRGLPIHTYLDKQVYEFELEAIFSRSWQYFAPLQSLTQPGDVVVSQVGKIPVAVARAEDGGLHGFVNICRHRGYTVVSQNKQRSRRFVCGYHGWCYNLKGELVRAPETDADFDKSAFPLLPVSVETFGPAVFVNPDPTAKSLIETHANLLPLTAAAGFKMDANQYELKREIVTDQKANWKLWYDNGVECYHCPLIHGKSFSEAFKVGAGDYSYVFDEKFTVASYSGSENKDEQALHSKALLSVQIFPGCQMVQQDDLMVLGKIVPTGPESCRFTAHYFAERGADPVKVERWIELWDSTYTEDARAVEIQQRNLRSGRAQEFRYVPSRESQVMFFNSVIWNAYKSHFADHDRSASRRIAN